MMGKISGMEDEIGEERSPTDRGLAPTTSWPIF